MKVYGIKNCDTVKKALKLLDKRRVEYDFVDFKKAEIKDSDIKRWKKSFGDWPVNKRGRIYKQFQEEFESANDVKKIKLLKEQTSLFKRPILEESSKNIHFGFDQDWIEAL